MSTFSYIDRKIKAKHIITTNQSRINTVEHYPLNGDDISPGNDRKFTHG